MDPIHSPCQRERKFDCPQITSFLLSKAPALALCVVIHMVAYRLLFLSSNFLPCPSDYFSNSLKVISSSTFSLKEYLRTSLFYFLPKEYHSQKILSRITDPIAEEVFFRVILQQFLLNYVPKKAIGLIIPSHKHLVDSTLAKITRVAFTAFLFAIVHQRYWDCSQSTFFFYQHTFFLYQLFSSGVLWGTIQEKTHNVAYPIILHIIHNVWTLSKQ